MKNKPRLLLVRASYLPGRMGTNIVPPLGILTLAGTIGKERPGDWDVKVLDTGLEKMAAAEVGRIIREYDPHVIGISALSLEAAYLHELAEISKQINPDIKVVAGGPHATCFYEDVLKDPNIDYAVVGEGEASFIDLLDALEDGAPADIPGVASVRDGEVYFGGPRSFIEDLDSIASPAWDMVDINRYSRRISMNHVLARPPYVPLFTSRACPYRCIYCHGIFGKKFRAQSPERVLDEIEELFRKSGVREFHFFDDIYNFDRGRIMAISEGVARRGLDVKFAFPNGLRGDLLDRDSIKALARMGTYSVSYAVETASPRLQKLTRKNVDLHKLYNVIEWTFDEGIIPGGFFMLGFPTETVEEMKETVRYACDSKMLKAQFFSVVPFPGTELYELARKTYPDYNFEYSISPRMYYDSRRPYYTEVSGIDVDAMVHKAGREFFASPWRLWHLMRLLPKNSTLLFALFLGLTRGVMSLGRPDEKMDPPPGS